VIEPARKLDTVRVPTEIGVASPHRVTFMRCLKRVAERDYRAVIAQACHRHATQAASRHSSCTVAVATPRPVTCCATR
jgi:phosphoribosylcarboxyaminoimidazole (NCAIR) mutase